MRLALLFCRMTSNRAVITISGNGALQVANFDQYVYACMAFINSILFQFTELMCCFS